MGRKSKQPPPNGARCRSINGNIASWPWEIGSNSGFTITATNVPNGAFAVVKDINAQSARLEFSTREMEIDLARLRHVDYGMPQLPTPPRVPRLTG
jgi:hypothetical protein